MATATIKIQGNNAYYKGVKLGSLVDCIINHFKLKNGEEYVITITEGSEYRITEDGGFGIDDYRPDIYRPDIYHFYKKTKIFGFFSSSTKTKYVGLACKQHFNNLFFVPDSKKRYSISVKKVRKE